MSSTSKLVFVCLHGAWHSPSYWNNTKALICIHGYTCICPAFPSTGTISALSDFLEDVDIIRSTVAELVEEKKDVIVVIHSYSGIPGGQALEALGKKTRTERGSEGGVIRLIYIMSFIVPEGFQHLACGTRDNMAPVIKTDFGVGLRLLSCLNLFPILANLYSTFVGTVIVEPEDAKGLFSQDLQDDVVSEMAKNLRPQSLGVFWSTTSYAAWKHVPTTYFICENDVPSTVVIAGYLLYSAQAVERNKVDIVVKRKFGHTLFLSQLGWMVSMLRERQLERDWGQT